MISYRGSPNSISATMIDGVSETLYRTDEDVVLHVDATMTALEETVSDEDGWKEQSAALSELVQLPPRRAWLR